MGGFEKGLSGKKGFDLAGKRKGFYHNYQVNSPNVLTGKEAGRWR